MRMLKSFTTVDRFTISGYGLVHVVISPEDEEIPKPGEKVGLDGKEVLVKAVESYALPKQMLKETRQRVGLIVGDVDE
jgi:hypothetical protein